MYVEYFSMKFSPELSESNFTYDTYIRLYIQKYNYFLPFSRNSLIRPQLLLPYVILSSLYLQKLSLCLQASQISKLQLINSPWLRYIQPIISVCSFIQSLHLSVPNSSIILIMFPLHIALNSAILCSIVGVVTTSYGWDLKISAKYLAYESNCHVLNMSTPT